VNMKIGDNGSLKTLHVHIILTIHDYFTIINESANISQISIIKYRDISENI
jgi:hypothetical protein